MQRPLFAIAGAATAVSVGGAISASELATWGGAIVTVAVLVWSAFRDQRRKDHDDERTQRMADWMLAYRIKQIEAGKADPFRDLVPDTRPDGQAGGFPQAK